MSCLFRVLLIFLVFGVPSCATGEPIGKMAAVDIALGAFSGILYYVPDGDDFRVVATVSSATDGAAPLRFSATLTRGQSVAFSVPGRVGEPEQRIDVARAGNRLFVTNKQVPRP
jgi:hypothetical protein